MLWSHLSRGGLGILLLLAPSGCMFLGPEVWVEETDQLVIASSDLNGLELSTHNGAIEVRGEDGREDILVKVHKKAGGQDQADAEAALRAIELLTETRGDVQDIRWRWNPSREMGWGARVAYEVVMPTRLRLVAKTHNGAIHVSAIDGSAELESHNGRLTVESERMRSLQAETHNGRVTARAPLETLSVETHNGRVEIDLLDSPRVGGSIQSHNGRLIVRAQPSITGRFQCHTHNGGIDFQLPAESVQRGKRSLSASTGGGGDTLKLVTHNGRIQILENERRFD